MQRVYDLAYSLFKELHMIPELSKQEIKTKEKLMEFISLNTSFKLVDKGLWFYAYKDEGHDKTIAYRADFDAVSTQNGPSHLCGHDGHSASLAGFLVLIDKLKLDKNVYAIFQYGEESGEGARDCASLIKEKKIDEIYSYHNIPSFEKGTCLIKHDSFALASTGLIIKLHGQASHAAYPSSGHNPSFAIGKLINKIERINQANDKLNFITVVGCQMGERAFGVSLGEAELDITLRSESDIILNKMIEDLKDELALLCDEYHLSYDMEFVEPFPSTINDNECVNHLINLCAYYKIKYHILNEPMHWSEDFGHYLKETKGMMFGIGNGFGPDLHTSEYEFQFEIVKVVWYIYLLILIK